MANNGMKRLSYIYLLLIFLLFRGFRDDQPTRAEGRLAARSIETMAESAAALVDVLTRVSMEEVMIACLWCHCFHSCTRPACMRLSTMVPASEATAEVANCAADAAAPTPQAHQLDGKPLLTEGHPRSHDDEEKGGLRSRIDRLKAHQHLPRRFTS